MTAGGVIAAVVFVVGVGWICRHALSIVLEQADADRRERDSQRDALLTLYPTSRREAWATHKEAPAPLATAGRASQRSSNSDEHR